MPLAGVIVIAALGIGLSACSNDNETAQAADAPIGIQTSQLSVMVENRAGGPLLDLTVGIVAIGVPPFTKLISRLEAGAKRDLSLSEFSSRDGSTFSLRQWKPRSVHVTATDLMQKKYDVEVPWK